MFAHASLGLELPSTVGLHRSAQLFLAFREHLVAQCPARPGRLLPLRPLAHELRLLLLHCEAQLERRIARIPPKRRNGMGRKMRKAYRKWQKAVERNHLTGHHLRLHGTERFCCYKLPPCAREQMLRQLNGAAAEGGDALRLVLVVPLASACPLALLDQLAVYLHAPARSATGRWQQLPDAHVQASVCGSHLVVVVE